MTNSNSNINHYIHNNNNNTHELKANKISNAHNINHHKNKSLLNANNVLIPVILSECLSYLRLKELNLIINRVNKYWKNHIYNNITIGYRDVELGAEQYKLLSQYTDNNNNTRNNINKGVNLLDRIKYSCHILFRSLNSIQVFFNIIKHAKYIQILSIDFDERQCNLVINDESWNNIRLHKLKALSVRDGTGELGYYLVGKLIKCVDSSKITQMHLQGIPIHSKPLQLFENNPFTSLTNLQLSISTKPVSDHSLNYISHLNQLIRLELSFMNQLSIRAAVGNWSWLTKLINLEQVILCMPPTSLELSNQTDCMKALISLPKLKELAMHTNLPKSNEFVQSLSQLKQLTSLSMFDVPYSPYDLDITFPTISSLIRVNLGYANPTFIIAILKSNPQINCIKLYCGSKQAKDMVDILQVAPSLLQYTLVSSTVDPILGCCETYPYSLVNITSSNYKSFINSTARQQLINRIKQHLQHRYNCPHCN